MRMADLERTQATQKQAAGLTSDLRALYRTPSMFSARAMK